MRYSDFVFSASSIERRCWCPMIPCHRSSFRMIINFRFSLWTDDIENGLRATMEHISKLLTNVGLFVLFLTSMTFVDRWIPLYVIALTVMDFSFLVAAQSFEGKHLPELKRLDNQLKTVELRARQAGQAKDIRMFHAAAFFGEMYKRAGDEKSAVSYTHLTLPTNSRV